MVYIAPSGNVQEVPPLLNRSVNILWSVFDFIIMFFQTLIPGLSNRFGNSIVSGSFRGSDNGGDGGGGSGSSGPKFYRSSRKNVKGFGSMADIPPPPSCGGCGCG